jgi:methylmalonyl-CoA decarboxylase
MSIIISSVENQIGTITLNNPSKRNVLSEELIHGITLAFEGFKQEKVRAVILRALPGTKIWSAGHDINELPNRGRDPLSWNDSLRVVVRTIQEFPAPVIALIEGSVWGGACETALCCDMIVATPDATFAMTPAKLGIPYNIGGLLTLLNAMPQKVVREMLFTAQPISADQALNFGIINYIKAAEEIDAFVQGLALQIAQNAPLSIAVMKEQMRILSSASSLPPESFEKLQGMRRTVYDSADYQEGIDSFKQKRKPVYTGT